ncbi:MAG: nicotinate-nucleotide adenylyltransferase [Gammaproteobacteria bacterium]|nr:nicotinate-nucleotide adenylyltransferase [Gammaproteobacteria bacterium]
MSAAQTFAGRRLMQPIGVFGGTFDPIHYGHLRTAHELHHALRLTEVRFLPCGLPPHREPAIASGECRLAMVRAATSREPAFIVDDRELRRDGPSYSVDTLLALRAEYPHRSLCLMVGMDAYLGLPKWYQWRQLLQLAHLVVAHRPGWVAPDSGPLGELLADRGTRDVGDLHSARAGRIFIHAVTQLEISSSALREMVRQGDDPRYLVPDAVRKIIVESNCYKAIQKETHDD